MTSNKEALDYLTGRTHGDPIPPAIGWKFSALGEPLYVPGNTVLCHLEEGGPVHRAVARAQDRLRAGPYAEAFAFLPKPSLHMTVFQGVTDRKRKPGFWPDHVSPRAVIGTATEDFERRLSHYRLPGPLRVKIKGIFGGFTVELAGANELAEAILRRTRDELAELTGIHRPDHRTYRFHITLAYVLRWLTETEAQATIALSDSVAEELINEISAFTHGPAEFCTFDTMHHFEPVLTMRHGPQAMSA